MAKAAEIPVDTFYFEAKKRLLERHIRGSGSVLDIGCGSGEYADFLSGKGFEVTGADLDAERKTGKAKFIALDIEKSRLPRKFDYVLMMDVLEHINDDRSAIRNAASMLDKNGRLVIITPTFKFLFGKHDLNCGHVRRYSKTELIGKVSDAGLAVEQAYYWNIIGFFSAMISKALNISQPYRQASRVSLLKRLILLTLRLEERIPIPFGLDLVCVASKAKNPS